MPNSWRFGYGVGREYGTKSLPIEKYNVGNLYAGWCLDWGVRQKPLYLHVNFVQLIWIEKNNYFPSTSEIRTAAINNPGSIWLIGNEPDNIFQGNSRPEEYAMLYHTLYSLIKEFDPNSKIAIGGITQVTPLRLRYLDLVLSNYQNKYGTKIPIDIWNVHIYFNQEKRGNWGCDIPPGFSENQGILYKISDSDNFLEFKKQILTFRKWMASKGERNKQLVISEFGVLMPELYGFNTAKVKTYMISSFDYLLSSRDSSYGCPSDGNLLVQKWAWFSLNVPEQYKMWTRNNLLIPSTGKLTSLGNSFGSYVKNH